MISLSLYQTITLPMILGDQLSQIASIFTLSGLRPDNVKIEAISGLHVSGTAIARTVSSELPGFCF